MLPSKWRSLQGTNTELFNVFEEFYKHLEGQEAPYFFASLDQDVPAVNYKAEPVFRNVVVDTAKEYDGQTGIWTPSRSGIYEVKLCVGFNGPAAAGDAIIAVLYKIIGTVYGSPIQMAYQGGGAIHWAKLAVSYDLTVNDIGDSFKPSINTNVTPTFNLIKSSTSSPNDSYFSAKYIRGFN